jgi:hypothetical protein
MQDIGLYLTKKTLEFIAHKEKCDVSRCSSVVEMILKLLENRVRQIKMEVMEEEVPQSILEKYGIKSRDDMRKWLVKNHPDRGGDSEIFIKVLAEFRKSGYK